MGQGGEVGVGGDALDRFAFGVDGIYDAVKAVPDQISEEDVTDLALLIARADDGDSLGAENRVEIADGHNELSVEIKGERSSKRGWTTVAQILPGIDVFLNGKVLSFHDAPGWSERRLCTVGEFFWNP